MDYVNLDLFIDSEIFRWVFFILERQMGLINKYFVELLEHEQQ